MARKPQGYTLLLGLAPCLKRRRFWCEKVKFCIARRHSRTVLAALASWISLEQLLICTQTRSSISRHKILDQGAGRQALLHLHQGEDIACQHG